MDCWSDAGRAERRQFEAIALVVGDETHLLEFLFCPDSPRLNSSPEDLLREGRGFCRSDYMLIKICVDLWCEQGEIKLHELFSLEQSTLNRVLRAIQMLSA